MALLQDWTSLLKRLPISALVERRALLDRMVKTWPEETRTHDESEAVAEMCEEVQDATDFWVKTAMGDCPIAFMKPSLEQTLVLNAWHPNARTEGFQNIDQSRLPDFLDYEGGYQSIGNFTNNRGGKTFVCCWSTVLWTIPYEEEWDMFRWHDDWLGRGKYRVLPRPDWDRWRKRGRLTYNGNHAPPKGACTIWHGVSRDDDWTQKVYPAYRMLIPRTQLGKRTDGEEAVYKLEKRFETLWGHQIIGMSMNAKAITWAGKECFGLNVDEGIPKDHFVEGITRIVGGGFYHQAYTPAEPANTAEMAMVARKIYKQEPGYETRGKIKCFVRFRLEDVPPWIIAPDKKEEDLKRFKGMGDAGKPRYEGGFIDSSPVVFTNFKRELHVLPWSTMDIVRAIRGEGPNEMVDIFGDANIIRGTDEGMSNPTACVWGALLRTGEIVYYRNWEQAGISITKRVEAIIDLSGNLREEVKRQRKQLANEDEVEAYAAAIGIDTKREKESGVQVRRFREVFKREVVRKTYMDFKIFKRDPQYPLENYANNYIRAGLKIDQSAHMGPRSRCQYLDDLMLPDPTRKHLNPDQGSVGSRVYMSRDCVKLIERMENYLNEQTKDGRFTDEPEDEDDHIVDGACFICCAKLHWVGPEEMARRQKNLQPA